MAEYKFTDVPNPIINDPTYPYGQQVFDNLKSFKAGRGATSMGMDEQGFWLGSDKFATAPFRVTMSGTVYIGSSGLGDLAWVDSVSLDTQVNDGTTYKKTTANEQTGASRAYSALNANARYASWLSAGEMAAGSTPATGVVFDSSGIRGYKASVKTFEISSSGDAYFRGDVYAVNGTFTGSISSSATITGGTIQTASSSNRIELSSTNGFRIFDSSSKVRVRMPTDGTGIAFFDASENTTGKFLGLTVSGGTLNGLKFINVDNNGTSGAGNFSVDGILANQTACYFNVDGSSTSRFYGKLRIPVGSNLY